MPGWFRNLSKTLLPRPEDGNACHEAAFDPDQFPDTLKRRLNQTAKEPADKTVNQPPRSE